VKGLAWLVPDRQPPFSILYSQFLRAKKIFFPGREIENREWRIIGR
jgi:hypothetical protein